MSSSQTVLGRFMGGGEVDVYTVVGNKDGTKTCRICRRIYIPFSTTILVLHFLLWIQCRCYNFGSY